MSPFRTLLAILAVFFLLGLLSFIFPAEGISFGSYTLRFPSLTEELRETAQVDSVTVNPEEQIQKMLEETRAKEFAEYADSLAFYEEFFRNGSTRFDFPDENIAWFDRFFQEIEEASDSGEVVHIVHYGDSQLEGDRITSTLREFLQTLWKGTGPGMVPPLADIPSFVFNGHSIGNLERHRIFGPASEHARHNKYGPLAQVTDLRGSATFTFKKSLHLKGYPHAGKFQKIRLLANKANLKTKLIYSATVSDTIFADSLPPKIVEKKKKFQANLPEVETFPGLSLYTWNLQYETESVTLTVSGNAELYTIALDANAGVAVDNVAMRGSSGTIFTKMDNALLASSLRAMNAKLIIMEYGGNLMPSVNKSNLDWVERILEKQILAIREAAPDADILFIGPADMSKKIGGRWNSFPSLEMTIEKIREIALRNGCAYWDMYRVMGGHNAMISWVKENLGGPDYIHFTRNGAARMGELLYQAIKLHYDHYRFRKSHGIDTEKWNEIHAFQNQEKSADTLIAQNDTLVLTPIEKIPEDDNFVLDSADEKSDFENADSIPSEISDSVNAAENAPTNELKEEFNESVDSASAEIRPENSPSEETP